MWHDILVAALSAVVTGALLRVGFSMGQRSSESTLHAARAVSEMTGVLADEANRQADLSAEILSISSLVKEQTTSAERMATAFDRLDANMALILDAMISRGMLRRANRPAQAGEVPQPPSLPIETVPLASPGPPTVTG
jgi:hypothetical protein